MIPNCLSTRELYFEFIKLLTLDILIVRNPTANGIQSKRNYRLYERLSGRISHCICKQSTEPKLADCISNLKRLLLQIGLTMKINEN